MEEGGGKIEMIIVAIVSVVIGLNSCHGNRNELVSDGHDMKTTAAITPVGACVCRILLRFRVAIVLVATAAIGCAGLLHMMRKLLGTLHKTIYSQQTHTQD